MIYPKVAECPQIPKGRDIWEYLGVTEKEYVHRNLGFRPKTVKLDQRSKEPVFFSFLPYSTNR
ncbi:MAG: hypothetical protein U9M95_02850 [Candidatus Altiarchaeota archaeon]|nr:hypothetical protein [Candidatus Altiarchaeota archaeon]